MPANIKTAAPVKQPSHRASIAGGILSVLGLIAAGVGYSLAHAHYTDVHPTTSASVKAGDAIADGTVHVAGVLFSLPFLIGADLLALLAIIVTLVRVRKVKVGGLVVSILWLALGVWTFYIVANGFHYISAK